MPQLYCYPDPSLTPAEFLRHFRLVRVLFPDPERALSYIAIRLLGWSPPKFVGEFGDLSLKEIERALKRQIIEGGYSASVIGYAFQPLRKILRERQARDLASTESRAQGDCALRDFFTWNAAADIVAWCRASDGLVAVARPGIEAGDAAFEHFWTVKYCELLDVLKSSIHRNLTTDEDIAHSTWLAIQLRHDTSDDWTFTQLWSIAREIHRRETRDRLRDVEYEDEMEGDGWFQLSRQRRNVPVYVKVALLEAIFDDASPPHEILVVLMRWLLKVPPRKIISLFAGSTLYEINSALFAGYLPGSSVPDSILHELSGRFDARLELTFRAVIQHKRRLQGRRRLLNMKVGWTRLEDYFKRDGAEPRATEIAHWLENIIKRLKVVGSTPSTRLHRALKQWRDELDDGGAASE